MLRCVVISLGISFGSISFASSSPSPISIHPNFYLKSFDESTNYSKYVGTKLSLIKQEKLSNYLSFDLKFVLQAEDGAANYSITDEYTPRNQIYMEQALVEFRPVGFFDASIGVIAQDSLDEPLIVSGESFASARQRLHWTQQAFTVSLVTQQSLAKGTTVRRTSQSSKKQVPAFYYEGLNLSVGQKFVTEARIGHYLYHDVDGDIALQSRSLGSGVSGQVADDAKFNNLFQGFTGKLSAENEWFKGFTTGAKYYVVQPFSSDKSKEEKIENSYIASAYVDQNISGSVLRTSFGSFNLRENVAPAIYMPKDFGHANRTGNSLTFELLFEKFSISLNGSKSSPIVENHFQNEFKQFSFSIRVNDADLL